MWVCVFEDAHQWLSSSPSNEHHWVAERLVGRDLSHQPRELEGFGQFDVGADILFHSEIVDAHMLWVTVSLLGSDLKVTAAVEVVHTRENRWNYGQGICFLWMELQNFGIVVIVTVTV